MVIGTAIRKRREKRGWSQTKLGQKCDEIAWTIDGRTEAVTRFQLNRIENGARKAIGIEEVSIIATALGCALADLLPLNLVTSTGQSTVLYWDAIMHPEYSQEVFDLMRRHQASTNEVMGWGQLLPCSLETRDFMEAHHHGLFSDVPCGASKQVKLIEAYNNVGNMRRDGFVQQLLQKREWKLWHLMYLKDVKRIAYGEDEYGPIEPEVRRACLLNLVHLLGAHPEKIQFVIAVGPELGFKPKFLENFDSRVFFGESLAVYRDHMGNLFWSNDVAYVREQRSILVKFRERAKYKADRTPALLQKLIADIHP